MGEIARRWNELSDEEKLAELRDPVITRCLTSVGSKSSKSRGKGEFLDSFERLVVSVRRKAMSLSTLEERAELVDRTWRQLQTQFRRRGVAPDFAAIVRRCLVSETISWPWFGNRIDYPVGEGE
jgi:hypothetical protein